MPLNWRVRSLNCETNWPRLMPNLPSDVPTGGAGVACPPGTWNFAWPVICFAFAIKLHRLYLPMFDLDRRRPAENVDHDRHAAMRLIDGVHVPFEILKVTFLDPHAVPRLERDRRLHTGAFLFRQRLARPQDPLHGARLHRRRLAGGTGEVA